VVCWLEWNTYRVECKESLFDRYTSKCKMFYPMGSSTEWNQLTGLLGHPIVLCWFWSTNEKSSKLSWCKEYESIDDQFSWCFQRNEFTNVTNRQECNAKYDLQDSNKVLDDLKAKCSLAHPCIRHQLTRCKQHSQHRISTWDWKAHRYPFAY